MIDNTISSETARRFYDWLGARHDMGSRFERRAKDQALDYLDLQTGHAVLNLGCGTGQEVDRIWSAIGPTGLLCALDLSRVMLQLTTGRNAATCPLQADAALLPVAASTFDRVLCTYVLDLIPVQAIPAVLAGIRRAIRPGGRLVLVSLTEGVDVASRAVVAAWKGIYRVHPLLLGACRPVALGPFVDAAGFTIIKDEVIVQLGVPSEIVVAAPR